MHPLLITIIIGPQRRVDLQVPGEILVDDLISALLETYGPLAPFTTKEPSRLKNQIKPELERRSKMREDKQEAAIDLVRPHMVLVLDGFTPHGALAQLPELDELFFLSRL